ncbi:MAG: glycoside-pentoside-hexuronide (GPH):cation symporter [Clostridiales bacterium]|jgi:melibiose permease/lactose/raffinose/galactose permease|nr:glycoside-pentoside-hexuronide (GPH):cation symporter [Clostridiales bacterium]
MKEYRRNRYTFGLGTIGRDMVFALMNMYLIFYLTDVLNLETSTLWWATGILVALRIFDAVTDPVMGFLVDNTKTRFGKFKPWIAIGAVASAAMTIALFTDFGLSGAAFVVVFAVTFFLWGVAYSVNDIAFWSLLPNLSLDLKEREKIGAIARICALVGLFAVVALIVPVTDMLADVTGSVSGGFTTFVVIVVGIMLAGQLITLFGVKEPPIVQAESKRTPFREMTKIIFKNDQLLWIVIAMGLFMVGYTTTVTFGIYFFEYVYGDIDMYPIFAVILGISQITSLVLFPLVSKRLKRGRIYLVATVLVVAGYMVFFFAPVDTMLFIGIGGVLIFIGQAGIQLIMLLFLADTVDYGHLKMGKRNDSITFSLQPFIYKLAGALANGIVGAVVILSGMQYIRPGDPMTPGGLLLFRIAMFILPLFCILVGYLIYRAKYRIDEAAHGEIIEKLRERGEIS